jgi:hypothetical protein
MDLTEARLERAKKLISLTAAEAQRWKVTVAELGEKIDKLFGDVFLASAQIAYNGPFTGAYRREINVYLQELIDSEAYREIVPHTIASASVIAESA